MSLIRPLPRRITRPLALAVVGAWVLAMALLVHRAYGESSSANLATDLARYGPTAVWHGVYYRGEKIGFTVDQTTRSSDGFELREDGQLEMTLFGSASPAAIHTVARVDPAFVLRSFEFSLDPGTGAVSIRGRVIPPSGAGKYRLALSITTQSTGASC